VANVLFVDDEEAIRRAVSTWLTRKGHVVYTAPDAESARDILRDHHVDGVFIDLWLGKDSGISLHDWLRDNVPPLARRTVFITGDTHYSSDQLTRAVRDEGASVVAKPFDLKELERIVGTWH